MNIIINGVNHNLQQQEIFNYMSIMCKQHKGCEGCFLAGGQTFKIDESQDVIAFCETGFSKPKRTNNEQRTGSEADRSDQGRNDKP